MYSIFFSHQKPLACLCPKDSTKHPHKSWRVAGARPDACGRRGSSSSRRGLCEETSPGIHGSYSCLRQCTLNTSRSVERRTVNVEIAMLSLLLFLSLHLCLRSLLQHAYQNIASGSVTGELIPSVTIAPCRKKWMVGRGEEWFVLLLLATTELLIFLDSLTLDSTPVRPERRLVS